MGFHDTLVNDTEASFRCSRSTEVGQTAADRRSSLFASVPTTDAAPVADTGATSLAERGHRRRSVNSTVKSVASIEAARN